MGFVEFHNAKDSYIWDKFRDGNTSAFEITYSRHMKVLTNYGNRMCQDKEMVKDAIQDLFVSIWKNRANLGNTESIKFYLIKAFRRNLVKKIIYAKRLENLDDLGKDHVGFELAHDIVMISDEIEQSTLSNLNKRLENLPPRQKEAVFLRFYSGLNYTEISRIMDINQQSAYNMVFRALEILRKKMTPTLFSFFLLLASAIN